MAAGNANHSATRDDVTIVLGKFAAMVGKRGICGTAVEKFILHNETTLNGQRSIELAVLRNIVLDFSTGF